jgi:ADP-heptose:LPS heptosyltransferase
MNAPKHIIFSKTDGIGDVVLSLPMAGLVKHYLGVHRVSFIVAAYTAEIVRHCIHVDNVILKEDFIKGNLADIEWHDTAIVMLRPDIQVIKAAFKYKIPTRIATNRRWYHWLYANKLQALSRKNSPLHETQLHCQLLKPLHIKTPDQLNDFVPFYGLQTPACDVAKYFDFTKPYSIVMHPKSKGSAREWPLKNYLAVAEALFNIGKIQILLTGTSEEGDAILQQCPELYHHPGVTNLTGKLQLIELMTIIAHSHALLACSTGPLHLAAAFNKWAIGLYPPLRPMHPGRWAPIGTNVVVNVKPGECVEKCEPSDCACMRWIQPDMVIEQVLKAFN